MRLTGLLLAVALATSRAGLVAHELVGHGGTALAVGGRVTEVQLFWFAGGWIRYHFAVTPGVATQLAIAMGGIAVELVAGLALWLLVRGDALGARLVRGVGTALVVHASWYFATGALHGYGDGQLLHHVLGSARVPVAIAAGAITCVCGYVGARAIAGPLAATQHCVAHVMIAAVLAGGLHAALAVGELELRHDATYAEVMQPEHERQVDRDLARWTAYERAHGAEVTAPQRAAEQARLEVVHRTFPFAWLLGACVVCAIGAGSWRSLQRRAKGDGASPISTRLLARACGVAAIAIVAVIAIDVATR